MSIDFIIPTQSPQIQSYSVYMMRTRYFDKNYDYKVFGETPSQEEIEKSKEMSINIDRLKLSEVQPYSTILECLNEADTVEFEQPADKTIFELNVLSSRIAKESRRGRGKIILSHPYSLKSSFFVEKNMQGFNIIIDTRLKQNEFYMMYRGVNDYDVPIVKFYNNGTKFVLNPMFKSMVKRFKLPY